MNRITYAGKVQSGEKVNKGYAVFLPDSDGSVEWKDGAAQILKGQVVIIPPLLKHCLNTDGECVILEQALLPFKKVVVLDDDNNRGIAHAVLQADNYFNSALPAKQLVLSALGDLIAGYVCAFSAESGLSPIVENVRAEILKRVSDCSFSLEDYMHKLPLNYDYVRKLFKSEVGVTPREFLTRNRMQLACGLILGGISNRYSEYTVSQIAEACGFSDPLYFSRVFKKYYGVPPSEYK